MRLSFIAIMLHPSRVHSCCQFAVAGFGLSGLAVIPFTYCWSFLFNSHSRAQNVLIIVYMMSGILFSVLSIALQLAGGTWLTLFSFFPNFVLARLVFDLSFPGSIPGSDSSQSPWVRNQSNLTYLAVESLVYLCLAIGWDWLSGKTFWTALFRADPVVYDPPNNEDQDAQMERIRVQRQGCDDLIQLRGLRKSYAPDKLAVKDLWFSVPQNQCFGFLGVNGAGKTTALRILCGDEMPSAGQAILGGFDLAYQTDSARKLIGYCPQFDALYDLLTGRETLEFYGRVRGVPENRLPAMVNLLLSRLSLTEYADRPSGTYSGGNKRKLSVGIALIGNPPIVFLDEPSSGVDPISKRLMWDFIRASMKKRAVILTTHSMEEAEALCHRIGIIVAGQMRCLGSAQRLKHLYGSGLQLDLAVAEADSELAPIPVQQSSSMSSQVTSIAHVGSDVVDVANSALTTVRAFIDRTFAGGVHLIEAYNNRLKYRLEAHHLGLRLGDVFAVIEQNKAALRITEYSIGQATLEQVFISFARGTEQQQALIDETDADADADEKVDPVTAAGATGQNAITLSTLSAVSSGGRPAAGSSKRASQQTNQVPPEVLAKHVMQTYNNSVSAFLTAALGTTPTERQESLLATLHGQDMDLEAIAVFGVSGWQTPSRYQPLNVPMGLAVKIAARLATEEQQCSRLRR